MYMEFLDSVEDVKERRFIHIIEHEGHGTLHQLIEPLQYEHNHRSFCTNNLEHFKFIRKDFHYIIHATGHFYPIISNLKLLLDNDISVSFFLHVAPKYFEFKEKLFFIDFLSDLQRKYKFDCFCPSEVVSKEYKYVGLNVKSIQIGFTRIYANNLLGSIILDTYCNKYISICTSSGPRYIELKGINEFIDMMEHIGKKDEALILGFDGIYRGVKCKRFSLNDFLYVLAHSKAYIQLSKTEAYNLTAVQAKQLKVPVLVSDIDGHIDCMKYSESRLKITDEIIEKICLVSSQECIDKNYYDSIERETLENFVFSIKENINGGKEHE